MSELRTRTRQWDLFPRLQPVFASDLVAYLPR